VLGWVGAAQQEGLCLPQFPPRIFVYLLGRYLLVAMVVSVPLAIPLLGAGEAATDVKAGKTVGPIRTPKYFPPLWQLPVLAIHADPLSVSLT
jgi:hypothetical protein